MKAIRIALAISLSITAWTQTGTRIMGGNVSRNGVGFSYETRLEPPSPPLADSLKGGTIGGTSVMHRYMSDGKQRGYFGYDILVEALPEANMYQVTIRPLSISADQIFKNDPSGWTKLALPGYPAPQTVRGGDTIALDLFTNAATGQKIVDYIRIQGKSREWVSAAGTPRDFSVGDAEMRLMEPHVSINGKGVPATANFTGGVSGAAVWFYLPDHGRYFLSLVPHPELGLQKAGEVRGSSLSFTVGGDTISMDCNGRIAPGYAPYNLYVFYDAGWRPKDAQSRSAFSMTSGDHIEILLRR